MLIAHRGASGYLPEHTLAGYALAIAQGADFIEPDLVCTRDGVLVARHENEISGTTDVASHAEFASRRRVQLIDGERVDGWFTEDFTLVELKTLRARERIPELRAANARYDGQFDVPTFDEILALLRAVNATRRIGGTPLAGVYPETKHPTHFASIGLALESRLLAALDAGLAGAPVFIQSFEVGNLHRLHEQCAYPLVQLMSALGGPAHAQGGAQGQGQTYAAMSSPSGLANVARYALAVGVQKSMVIRDEAGTDGETVTSLVRDAHAAGLGVHVWTFRAENAFLPARFRRGDDASAHGDLSAEISQHLTAGIDALFSDFPDIARTAIAATPLRQPDGSPCLRA
jgi:glycerophosphoryl diester phosphodiesterase